MTATWRGLARFIQRTVHFVVQAKDFPRAGERHQFNFLRVARLEPDGGARRNVETKASRRGAVEGESSVDLEEMKMTADLDRTVAGVRNPQCSRRESDVGVECGRGAGDNDFSGDHNRTEPPGHKDRWQAWSADFRNTASLWFIVWDGGQ